jgi:hypothetical protein
MAKSAHSPAAHTPIPYQHKPHNPTSPLPPTTKTNQPTNQRNTQVRQLVTLPTILALHGGVQGNDTAAAIWHQLNPLGGSECEGGGCSCRVVVGCRVVWRVWYGCLCTCVCLYIDRRMRSA